MFHNCIIYPNAIKMLLNILSKNKLNLFCCLFRFQYLGKICIIIVDLNFYGDIMKDYYSSKEYFELLNKYLRAANYLTVAQLYLKDNPLLRKPLERKHIKDRLLGHWGTCAGQNFVYAHCDRVIKKYNQDMVLLSGPGHGGNFFVSNCYLEGTYSEYYPKITQNEAGLKKLCKQFSFPGGIPSHVAPETPGSIHEGGELGYSLAHGFGAVLDNPNLIAAVVVGDGEAETGPLATSWNGNKFISAKTDGAVLPILHLNGYKINSPTVLARLPHHELESLFVGYGYKPYFVEGNDPVALHPVMAKAMDCAIADIKKNWQNARKKGVTERPVWPMIILRTPKGWTGPKEVDGQKIEDYFLAHQIPISMSEPNHFDLVKEWLESYHAEELFDKNGKLKQEIAAILPTGDKRLGATPYANGGKLLKEIVTPDLKDLEVKFDKPGTVKVQDMRELGGYIRELFELNKYNKNYRIFSPDEAKSNRLYRAFDVENRPFEGKLLPTDDKLSTEGRIMDGYLSEHSCEGWLEGYILTGRHGMFDSYEAFMRVVDSMVAQHCKWLRVCNRLQWRAPISSLNLVLTSTTWQQDHNGYTHQDTGFITHIAEKAPEVTHIYLPADANTLLAVYDKATKSKNKVNVITASKKYSYQWLHMDEAIKHVEKGASVWDFACLGDKEHPDVVIATAGDTPTKEAIAALNYIHKYLPKLNVRFVNVCNLMALTKEHPDGLSDVEFDKLFTKDKPVIFNFHGYAELIKGLVYDRHNKNFHVFGYQEEGTVTTPFDMRVKNHIDRCHLVLEVANSVELAPTTKKKVTEAMQDVLTRHDEYIREHGVDMPEIDEWKIEF